MRAAHLVVAVAVLLAGCSAVAPGAGDGTVNVYVSDEPGAIDQFEHVNLTITELSLRSASSRGEHDDAGHHPHRHHDRWTTYDLNETTVDLTQLRGANASLLHAVDVPEGEYTAVAVGVADVNATLESGERADVRVPGDRLRIKQEFTVGGNDSVDFVVDAVVRERDDGYVVVPNPEKSGTNVDIQPCDCHCDCCDGNWSGHGNWSHHGGGMHGGHHNGTQTDDGCRHG